MKQKLIEDKTFNTFCRLFWDCSEEDFLNYANKKNGTNYVCTQAAGKSITYVDEKRVSFYMWINRKNNFETIAHEVLHLIRFWLQDYQGIKLSPETEEIYTLLHSFYFNQILTILGYKKYTL